jgi:hypothetical protein
MRHCGYTCLYQNLPVGRSLKQTYVVRPLRIANARYVSPQGGVDGVQKWLTYMSSV